MQNVVEYFQKEQYTAHYYDYVNICINQTHIAVDYDKQTRENSGNTFWKNVVFSVDGMP